MNPPLEYRAWDNVYRVYYLNALPVPDGLDYRFKYTTENSYVLLPLTDRYVFQQYTGHKSIDDQKVFNGDLLRFPDQKEVYEVRWDNDEGGWGVFYKDMNCFKIGMTRFMQVVGNVFEGEISTDSKENE